MEIRDELVEGRMVRRLNRFAVVVEVEGEKMPAHVPNSGRMRELLYPGAEVLLARRTGNRKTSFDLLLIRQGSRLVGTDSRLPPRLVEEALRESRLPELGRFDSLQREVRFGLSRLDLLGHDGGESCFIETKSVNLVRDGVALFPDAPTTRGTRHLEELRRAVEAGYRAAAVFVVQRDDARSLRPFGEADPALAAALRAVSPAVQLLACICEVARSGISITRTIPVEL